MTSCRAAARCSTRDEEIRDHIERETRDNIERGMAPDAARRKALLTFGNRALARDDTRAAWGGIGWNSWRRTPGTPFASFDGDRLETEPVVVVNESFVRRYFPGADPIGRSIGVDGHEARTRIVGVVGDAAEKGLADAAEPVRYVAVAQMPWIDDAQSIVVRTTPGAETSLLEPARRTIARVAPSVAIQRTTTMRRVLDSSVGACQPTGRAWPTRSKRSANSDQDEDVSVRADAAASAVSRTDSPSGMRCGTCRSGHGR